MDKTSVSLYRVGMQIQKFYVSGPQNIIVLALVSFCHKCFAIAFTFLLMVVLIHCFGWGVLIRCFRWGY